MPFPKHVHAKRKKVRGPLRLASKLRYEVRKRLQAVVDFGSALREWIG